MSAASVEGWQTMQKQRWSEAVIDESECGESSQVCIEKLKLKH